MTRTQAEIMQFVPASELPAMKDRDLPRKEDRRFVCEMCGRDAGPLCDQCLEDLIETKAERIVEAVLQESISRLIDQGRLDAVMQRILDRRLARASITTADEHELVDEASGIIRD
ncbi:MAG: hypothetical protein GXX95_01080 [Methanomassiliicoccus sp.]|nr:hypothetical protein [Methanomassiliicoccus sp.]